MFCLHALASVGVLLAPQSALVGVPASRQAANIAIISIHGEIDGITLQSVTRRVEEAARAGCTGIVLELDTPGGDAMATLSLTNQVKSVFPANTVAWIRPHAFSAGAIIALSCREIVVAPGAAFGDAAPIMALPGVGLVPLPATERAKAESPIISEVIDSARRRGYDETLVQAFVRLGSELWLVERTDGSARAVIDAEEYQRVFGLAPPRAATIAPSVLIAGEEIPLNPLLQALAGSRARPGRPDRPDLEIETPVPTRTRLPLGAADRNEWKLLGQIVRSDTLLVVREQEAAALGLSHGTIADERELLQFFGAQKVTRFDESWSEGVARFMMSWPMRIALLIAMLMCFFTEMALPGSTWFGVGGVVALGLLVGAPVMAGAAEWWEVATIVTGLLFLAAEVLVIPGMGIAGFLGGALLLVGLVGTFTGADISSADGRQQALQAAVLVIGSFFLSGVGMWQLGRHLPRTKLLRRFVLAAVATEGGAAAHDSASALPIGTTGVAATTLRPSGRAEFGGKLYEVASTGTFIDAARSVQIVGNLDGVPQVEETHL